MASTGHQTANDRFKASFSSWFWGGLILATLGHAVVFAAGPRFGVENVAFGVNEVAMIELPDEIRIPEPPEDIARPPTPVIADVDFDADLTIPLTTLDANPVDRLPPPPQQSSDLSDAPTFTPMTVRPTLVNGDEIARALVAYYPPLLRDAGIGGVVHVWFFIDEAGRVQRTMVNRSSGYEAMDLAALQVADRMRFTPGYNMDRAIPVWVSIAVTFEVGLR